MKYQGGCHCEKVRFEVEMEIQEVLSCNCSICLKKGQLLAFALESDFTLLSGSEVLKDYPFGKKIIHHIFCTNCGIAAFGSGTMPNGTKMRGINVRCLDNIDLEKFTITPFDGRSI